MTPAPHYILVADDLETNRDALVRLLTRDGYRVDAVRDGVEAIEAARTHDYDCLLLDVMMPRMDGIATLESLRQDRRTAQTPVIMLSAYRETRFARQCIELGADDFLQKPIDRLLLRARLQACIRRKRLQDREREYLLHLENSNQELRRLHQLKSRYLSILSHDLKTPMTTLLVLLDQLENPSTQSDSRPLYRMRLTLERMVGILQGVLDSATGPTEGFVLRRNAMDPFSLLEGIAEEHADYAQTKAIRILLPEPPAPSLSIEADRHMLASALDNLVSNAIKFSPLGRTVTLGLEPRQEDDKTWIRITVTDQGPGLTEEDRSQAFTSFQRLSALPTAGESTTGLGLSIAREMVELHGGRIWVESVPGAGATFGMDLPASLS